MILIMILIIIKMFSKDARLPVQLQRAMAAEAEAAREARAKVINIIKVWTMTTRIIITYD